MKLSALFIIGFAALGIVAVSLLAWRALSPKESTNIPAESPTTGDHIIIDDRVMDAGDPYAIIDPVWWRVNTVDGESAYVESLDEFSQAQRYLCAIVAYMAEVNNGGHAQFYFNSAGIVWRDALAGFRAIGFEEGAILLEESASRMGGSPSMDREARITLLEELDPDFEDLDDRFYELESSIDIDQMMMDYIDSRRADFYFDGMVEKPDW